MLGGIYGVVKYPKLISCFVPAKKKPDGPAGLAGIHRAVERVERPSPSHKLAEREALVKSARSQIVCSTDCEAVCFITPRSRAKQTILGRSTEEGFTG